jgi:dCTP deaminase
MTNGGVVSGKDLVEAIDKGLVVPRPSLTREDRQEEWVVSLHLGDQFLEYHPTPRQPVVLPTTLPTRPVRVDADGSVILHPGASLLACTQEMVDIPLEMMGWVYTKGNIARGFLTAHVCDAQIDPGYSGKITLELINHGPLTVVLKPGMAIANLYLMRLTCPVSTGYGGKFWGAAGPTPMLGTEIRPNSASTVPARMSWFRMSRDGRESHHNGVVYRSPFQHRVVRPLWLLAVLQLGIVALALAAWLRQ